MTTTPTLRFEPNVETKIKMLCSGPLKKGTNEYGEWWLFSVEYEGEKHSLFPDPELYVMLKDTKKGDVLTIKKETKEGKLLRWVVNSSSKSEPKEELEPSPGISNDSVDWEAKEDLKHYLINVGQSWNLAVQLFPEMDIEKLSIEADRILFGLTDHFARAKRHLGIATNQFHLQNIFTKYYKTWKRLLTKREMNEVVEYAKELKEKFEEQQDEEVPF
jgi:hypothetical protein